MLVEASKARRLGKESTRLFDTSTGEAPSWLTRPRHRRLRVPSSRELPSIGSRSPPGNASSGSDRSKPASTRSIEGDEGTAGRASHRSDCAHRVSMLGRTAHGRQCCPSRHDELCGQRAERALPGGRQACVATDTFVYFENGEPRSKVSPDVLVVMRDSGHVRNSCRGWEADSMNPRHWLHRLLYWQGGAG